MDHSYLNDTLILVAAAVAVVLVCLRLRLPSILGYLSVGVLVGPYGLAWIADTEYVRAFAEFGVVFLLFTIGLEFSLPLLIRMKSAVLGLGASQVLLTTAITAVVALYLDFPVESALVLGGVVAMSSTALVIRQLTDQVELHSSHGRNAVGILLCQDVMVIPFLILASTPSDTLGEMPAMAVVIALGKGAIALIIIFAVGHWVLRPLFRAVAGFKSSELFMLTALLVAMGAAWLTYQMGLSLALGAFVAGMMLGETEFRHQVEAEIRPFRDLLLGLFFITIGMLLNVGLLPELWPQILLLLALLLIFKLILIGGLCRLAGWDNAISLRTGLVLAHGGEFGFAILALALSGDLLPVESGQVVLAALLISMGLAPLLIRDNGSIAAKLLPADTMEKSRKEIEVDVADTAHGLSHHVIICGYGRVGQNVAQLLAFEGIRYVALDLDPILVQNAIEAKEPVSYGDGANIHLLKAAGLAQAAALMISLKGEECVVKIVHQVRQIDTKIPILVRTADETNLKELQEAGATEVVPETLEASLMLASHLLIALKVPTALVSSRIRQVRRERYTLLQQLYPGEESFTMPGGQREQLRAIELPASTWVVGRSIGELELEKTGATVTAIQRQGQRIPNPSQEMQLLAGDTLILFGTPEALEQAEDILS
ncbi:Inner membrane protein, KefB/KefC family [hydrothermal vent metagenome]|uniref:Inner membrane protein, KefB/KefC family n=1 Tax=hydrothermal vent metagenome TaxID=652676 RepID=A0A3B1AXG3_9ZZZZ